VIEILVLSGEVHPHSLRRDAWFQHIQQICQLALSLGFLPHTNAGPLSRSEMARLQAVNVSMGLMLEQVMPQLLQTVHRHAPSKVPELRLQQLIQAGELGIPFTTGLLLGIGETESDRRDTLRTIAQVHRDWGHIQEVILQPYSPGQRESWASAAFSTVELIQTIAIARDILPPDIALQIPPNLVPQSQDLIACLQAGARDLGGIGPRDEVNPDYPHAIDSDLATLLASADWQLTPRLPIYPQYDSWLPVPLQQIVADYRRAISDAWKNYGWKNPVT
jgi:FO synthase subunit 1